MTLAANQAIRQEIGHHLMVGFQGVTLGEELKALIRDYHIGGIVLFRRNIESRKQLQTLLEETQAYAREISGRRLWIAIDQEGGPVQRLDPHFTRLPSAKDLASEGISSLVHWVRLAARELRSLGIQINLAPVLDVVGEGASHFMEARSLGSDPKRVGQLGRLWIQTLQEEGVSATAKHFPGLGRAESDPHHFAPVIRWADALSMERDLSPFRAVIDDGVHCVMTSHALYPFLDPHWPATLSPIINHDWLRERLDFEGVLLSDDMDMAAVSEKFSWEEMARQGFLASIDFFLLCQRSTSIDPFFTAMVRTIENDPDVAAAHHLSLERIGRLSQKIPG